MPSIAVRSQWDALRFNLRTLMLAAVPPLRASRGSARDDLTARALAAAGLAAVLGLPFLMFSSIVLDAPLAVPAAIASGYLAVSHALASKHPDRAAFLSGLVVSALVGWLLLYFAQNEAPLSRSGLTAALMTPLFAAAPALARSILAPRPAAVPREAPLSRETALQRVACLDEFAPSEAVIILDREGCTLAATNAARQRLRFFPDAFEYHIASIFDSPDVSRVRDAVRRCSASRETVRLPLGRRGEDGERAESAAWMFSPSEGGAISMRLTSEVPLALQVTSAEAPAETVAADAAADGATISVGGLCDVSDAVAFALRRTHVEAENKGISVVSAFDRDIHAACDRQAGRRIVHLAIEHALRVTAEGGTIRVDARRLKGIILLRVVSDIDVASGADGDAEAGDPLKLAMLRMLVEDNGGTLVIDRGRDCRVLSIRLALADTAKIKDRMTDRAEAS